MTTEPPIQWFEEVDSTNALAARAARAGDVPPGGVIFAARRQTEGVGQRGRRWLSPIGGLWCSFAWPLGNPVDVLPGLGLRVGVACLRSLDEMMSSVGTAVDLRLKWPNDVLLNRRKVCGTLCETIASKWGPTLVVGVGMNVNNRVAEGEVGATATSVVEATGSEKDVEQVLLALRGHLMAAVRTGGLPGAWLESAQRGLHGPEGWTAIRDGLGGACRARLEGMADNGRVMFTCLDGPVSLVLERAFPEVHFRSSRDSGTT